MADIDAIGNQMDRSLLSATGHQRLRADDDFRAVSQHHGVVLLLPLVLSGRVLRQEPVVCDVVDARPRSKAKHWRVHAVVDPEQGMIELEPAGSGQDLSYQ